MNRSLASALSAMAVILSVVIPMKAHAQGAGAIEEILVTATKRSQSMQDVAISMSAFSGEQLEELGIDEPLALNFQIPGLMMNQQNGGLTPVIRGIGTLDVSAGQESSVSVYIDGMLSVAPYGNTFSFNNIERIEVLKGPQGTLFGRNSAGGLIHVITKTPQQETEVYGSVSFGDYDTLRAKLYATTGLSDTLAADIAITYLNQDKGYGENVDTGTEFDTQEDLLIRSKWLWTPTEKTTVTAAFMYSDTEYTCCIAKQFLPDAVGLDGVTGYTGDFYNITGLIDPDATSDGYNIALTIEHEFANFTIKSITSYQELDAFQSFDNDQTLVPIVDVWIDEQLYETWTQEIQLISNTDSRLQWIVGAFYMDDEAGFGGPYGLGLEGAGVGGVGLSIDGIISTESIAVFGEITYAISESTELTVGARYTDDQRDHLAGIQVHIPIFDADGNFVGGPEVAVALPPTANDESWNEPTYRVILSHRFNDQVMVFGSYSRGFKAGNFNAVGPFDLPTEPEIVDTFEIGFKSDLFDRRLRLNGAIYYNEYDDIQLGVTVGPSIVTVNATSAESQGFEFDATAVLSDNLELLFGFSYIDSEILDFPNAICFFPNPAGGSDEVICDASGNTLPRAPEFTFNIAPTLTVPMGGGHFRATIGLYYNDGFFWTFDNVREESSYTLLNASIGWTAADERWGIRLFGANLLDEEYSRFTAIQGVGDSFVAANPMTYSLELNFRL